MLKITDVTGIGPVSVKILSEHNITTVEALVAISLVDLKQIHGFSDLRARAVKKAAAECLQRSAKQAAHSANSLQAPVKKALVKKPVARKPAAIEQQAAEPVTGSIAWSKNKDNAKIKAKDRDKDKVKAEAKMPVKKALIKKPVARKSAEVAQQAAEPVAASTVPSKKKDKAKTKTKNKVKADAKIKDQDKKKKNKNKKKSSKKKGKEKK